MTCAARENLTCFRVHKISALRVLQKKNIEDMMSVVVEDTQVVRLVEITHNHLILHSVFFLYLFFRNLISHEFLYPFYN